MSHQLLETMPLRDRIREAERLARELTEHLELGFLTKIHAARSLTRKEGQTGGEHVTDISVRTAVDAALTSHEYTVELTRKLDRLLDSINRETNSLVSGNMSAES
ncbi:MAG: hypothetical protein ACK5Q5_02905 [Planctomycetaceae bacterium]